MTIIYKHQSLINKAIKNKNKNLNWKTLSLNPNAIHFLKQNSDKIDWMCL